MLSVSYAGKNAYSAGQTSGVLRVGASGALRGYVLAHCAWGPPSNPRGDNLDDTCGDPCRDPQCDPSGDCCDPLP